MQYCSGAKPQQRRAASDGLQPHATAVMSDNAGLECVHVIMVIPLRSFAGLLAATLDECGGTQLVLI